MFNACRFFPALAFAALMTAGCSGSEKNDAIMDGESSGDGGASTNAPSESDIRSALDKYFKTHAECTPFFDMPADVRIEKGSYRIGQLDAFVAAGVVQRSGEIEKPHDGSGAPERYARYVPTTLGNESIKPTSSGMPIARTVICYARRKATSVTGKAPDEYSPDRVSIKYSYELTDIPSWAHARSIQDLYPGFASWLDDKTKSSNEELQRIGGVWTLTKLTDVSAYDLRHDSH